ncbi:FG-GAP-like repeat-containing protein [Nocardioides cheoyonin]|uniref:FG-GAP-like repeat-containing protein n=1 Tax=Nocardioides cheoyonin TaxID=3156615 RepID=UPI0032B53D28
MHPTKDDRRHAGRTRFVATCQQLLVLGAVFAALIPAASVVSLDVVKQAPGGASQTLVGPAAAMAAYIKASDTPSTVPAGPVSADVREVALTPRTLPKATSGTTGRALLPRLTTGEATAARPTAKRTVITSEPQAVSGFGVVGVTWSHGDRLAPSAVRVAVRTEKDGIWGRWKKLEYDDDGPDPSSAEGRAARPGTIEGLVGHVDRVQARLTVTGTDVPADLKLAIIDPGTPTATKSERPSIDTGDASEPAESAGSGSTHTTSAPATGADTGDAADSSSEDAVLAAAAYTPKPQIYSRAQWGANERLREQIPASYYEIHGGFVHHTVNANDYTRAEVPGIIRSIYAYHVQSRGWRDIGYNFLLDKFGRIWEGRYGGVARPVVGAHTENYNDYGFGAAAIGNFETAKPSSALIQAYGALFAWKLALHGVNANATNVRIGGRVFPHAIEGHRDTKATACPGRYLYARIPDIRRIAASLQKGWSGRELDSQLAATKYPDLVARRASDKRIFVIPTGGMAGYAAMKDTTTGVSDTARFVLSPDLSGDGRPDLLVIYKNGTSLIRKGLGGGKFGEAVSHLPKAFVGRDLATAVGDLNGDGKNDLVGRTTTTGALTYFLGNGTGGFRTHVQTGRSLAGFGLLAASGDLDGDGRADLVGRKDGRLYLFRGAGNGTFGAPTAIAATTNSWSSYAGITGYGDIDNDGDNDLFARTKDGRGWTLPGNGKGGFGKPLGPYVAMRSAGSVIGMAQMAGNLIPDLLVRTGTKLGIVPSNGRRNLAPPIDTGLTLPNITRIMVAGDWDRDGHGDFITRNTSGVLYLYRGTGNGRFRPAVKLATGFGNVRWPVVAGDITGDGYPDIQGQMVNGKLRIWPGRGTKGLGASYVSHSAISASAQIPAGRWNGDGAPDSLFRADDRLTLYPGNGPGGLMNPVSVGIGVSRYNLVIGVRDLRGGSGSDLVVREKKTGDLYALQRRSDLKVSDRVYLGPGGNSYDLID